jgi:hypothetical protein
MMLNPYKDKPNKHIYAFGPIIRHINSSQKVELIRRFLELNRPDLRDKRQEKIEELEGLISKYHLTSNPTLKGLIEVEILDFIERIDYSFTLKRYSEDAKNIV